jgi:hypothetical protein
MDESKKKIIAGAGIIATFLAYLLLARRGPAPPGPPPGENYGRAWGYIRDIESNARIVNARVYMDGEFSCYTDVNGAYGTDYVPFGSHTLTVEADNYQTGSFPIVIDQSSVKFNLILEPLPVAPTDWTEGVEVREVEVDPPIIYLGQTVTITVRFDYSPLPLPEVIHGTVLVDDTELSSDFYNPIYLRARFDYTPVATGNFLARAQNKSADFTVYENVPATYYLPHGGTRMPIATEIVVPDVPPFSGGGKQHPGGDYVMQGSGFFCIHERYTEVVQRLVFAYPTKLNPSNATVEDWLYAQVGVTYGPYSYRILFLVPVNYTCQEYWDSKEELARIIGTGKELRAGSLPGLILPIRPPQEVEAISTLWWLGLRDWVKYPEIDSHCFQGCCTFSIECPYCDKKIESALDCGPLPFDKVAFAKRLLSHIEDDHADHPLTEPAWF